MKTLLALCALTFFLGCESAGVKSIFPPNPERVDWWDRTLGHRDGLRAYHVQVESAPGSRIEVNGEHLITLTNTTGEIILWADANGTFPHDHVTIIKAYPSSSNQFLQTLTFSSVLQRTYVPHAIYFDLSLEKVRPLERIETKTK